MKSLLHPCVSNFLDRSGGRCFAIFATITTSAVGGIVAQESDQTNMVAPEDPFNVRMPSVDEDVTIGGFQLRVDRTKWGIELNPSNHGLLGRLDGDDVIITVTEVSGSQPEAAIGAGSMHSQRVFTRHAIPGLKIVYGENPSLFSQNIWAIRYLFVNSEGKMICFEARANTANPEWSAANNLVLNTLAFARRTVPRIGRAM